MVIPGNGGLSDFLPQKTSGRSSINRETDHINGNIQGGPSDRVKSFVDFKLGVAFSIISLYCDGTFNSMSTNSVSRPDGRRVVKKIELYSKYTVVR